MRSDSNEASSNVEKANLLNQVLSRNLNYDIEPLSVSIFTDLLQIHHHQLVKILHVQMVTCFSYCVLCINTTKVSGPDGISGRMLKGTAESITPSLINLLNMSIKSARVPTAWKISSVVLTPKNTNKTENPSQYRPNSLLSLLSKLLENVITVLACHTYHLPVSYTGYV